MPQMIMPRSYRKRYNPLEQIPLTTGQESKVSTAPDLTGEDSKLVSYINSRVSECATALYPMHKQWVLNKALRIGQQYNVWSNTGQRLKQKRVPSYRERHVTNLVNPVIRTYVAQFLKNRPAWDVLPGSNHVEKIFKARYAKKALDYHWIECQWDRKQQIVAPWMFECGIMFAKIIFDPTAGPLEEATDMDGEALLWEDGSPMQDKNGNPLSFQPGGIQIIPTSPFHILIDPNHTGLLDDAPYIIEQSLHPLTWFEEKFPGRGQYVTGTVNTSERLWLERQFQSLASGQGRRPMGATSESVTKWDIYTEIYERPNEKHPNGRLISLGGDTLLREPSDSPWLYGRGARPDRDWHPYVDFWCVPVGGRYWPLPVVNDVQGIQKAVNSIMSNLLEVAKLTGKPKWGIPIGTVDKGRRITSEPGENIPYNHALGPPHPIPPPDMPSYIFNLLDVLMKHLDFTTLQHGPSRGQAPTGVKSGIGLSLLQEQDEMDLGPISKLWETSLQEMGRKVLLRMAQFWETPRKIRLMGPDREFEAFTFKGSDISSDFDVIVEAGSSLPKSRAANMAFVKDLVNMGIYLPAFNPLHRRRVMEMLEVGTAEERIEGERAHERRAGQENILIKRGINVSVEWFQNHEIHIESHLNFMNSDEYRRLSAENSDLEVRMHFHVAMHAAPQNTMSNQELGMGQQGQQVPGQEPARQGSVPMGNANPSGNLQPLQGMAGLPQSAMNANQSGQPAPGM